MQGTTARLFPLCIEATMGYKLPKWTSLLAATAIVTACSDAPEPVAPAVAVRTSMSAPSKARVHDEFEKSSPVVLDLPGTVFADHDEVNNRLVFGVEKSASIRGIRTALERLGIPSSDYTIQVTEPIYFASTLRDRFRPTQAGIQIHFGGYLCSLGFNADDGAERSFITASHCTNKQGGVEGTQYYQPLSSVDGTVIATEVEDPIYVRGGPGCSKSKMCRSSDASRALYTEGVTSTRGAIARTSAPNNGSLDVLGSFAVTSQDNTTFNFAVGTTINKVGRTTGWTQGNVTQSCVNTNVSGSRVQLLCQTFVQNPGGAVVVGGGDSGSDVFIVTGGTNAQMVGVLWGGNGNGTLFVFSPLKQVQDELGALVVTQ
jgi:hypothetical protein